MKIKDWREVELLVLQYQALGKDFDLIATGHGLGVTIQGKYQDDDMCTKVLGVVMTELLARQRKISNALLHLGVSTD
jgi:hypothetical protein